MREHRYMAQNLGRKTWLKGTFTGHFVGRLDPYHSDARHERFFDLEVTQGHIVARQDQITTWQQGEESPDFTEGSTLQVRLPGRIAVALHYLDGSVKHFKIDLKEIKLIRCGLSDKVYDRDEVHGTIRGEVSGYILHRDTVVNEITESVQDPKETIRPLQARALLEETTSFGLTPAKTFNLHNLFLFPTLALLVGTLIVSENKLPVAGFFLLGSALVLWQYKKGLFRTRARRVLAILLYCLFFAIGLGWLLSHAIGKERKTPGELAALQQTATSLVETHDYSKAIKTYNTLIDHNKGDATLLLKRAVCYVGLGKIREAVIDLKPLLEGDNKVAIRLHDSINPVKKRRIGTQIRCRDGTISYSKTRQGTCSHHGGVENWEEPVYEEYREYD